MSFNDDIGLSTYVKIRKSRKSSSCKLVGDMTMDIIDKYPGCEKEIPPKSTVYDIWEYRYWGNSLRKQTQLRYCGECAIKYNMEEGGGTKAYETASDRAAKVRDLE